MPTSRTQLTAQVTFVLLHLLAGTALAEATPVAVPDWLAAELGGPAATVAVQNQNAFAQPSGELSSDELRKFTFGNRLFNTNWVAAPASVTGFDGLGPLYNRVSCSGCHTRDGRGRPPSRPSEALSSMLVRISLPGQGPHGAPMGVPRYGDQLNEKALPQVAAEASTRVHYTEKAGRYPDGTRYTLAVPHYTFGALGYGPWPDGVLFSPRVAPALCGLGLLQAIPEADLLANEDPDDQDGDGVSGRANWVWDVAREQRALGRFGWKANQPTLQQQNAGAALGDIGLTSSLFPAQNIAEGQAVPAPLDAADAPELEDSFLARLTLYVQALAVPAARHIESPEVRRGAQLFEEARCTTCHVPTFKTGDEPSLPALSFQVIHPFSDLLLHDMGEELADGRSDFDATGREWRTPPLWGIGLTAVVNRHTRFLHDGRARSLEEAILWHGGEASAARDRFMHLSKKERRALLSFLENL